MPKTAVGLFENPAMVEQVVNDIAFLGFRRQEIRTLEEPDTFPVTGVMSFTRLDFEIELRRELSRIGASQPEVEDYMLGLRRGGALVMASGPDSKVEEAAKLMNSEGAIDVETSSAPKLELPEMAFEDEKPKHEAPVQVGRIREESGGARLFVW